MLPPVLAWGLLARGLGIVYAISFVSIALQIRSLAGSRGIASFAATLRQIRHDFPTTHHLHFPSLFWLVGASDAALLAVPLCGALCGTLAALGAQSAYGEATVFCWLAMRTLDLPVGLLYPWDSLLLEAGALAMLLPAPPPVWRSVAPLVGSPLAGAGAALALARPPHPWVAAAFRWLLARLMLGFGKKKVSSSHSNRRRPAAAA